MTGSKVINQDCDLAFNTCCHNFDEDCWYIQACRTNKAEMLGFLREVKPTNMLYCLFDDLPSHMWLLEGPKSFVKKSEEERSQHCI